VRHWNWMGSVAWMVAILAFLSVAGGLHPTDTQRDLILAGAGAIILALHGAIFIKWRQQARQEGGAPLNRMEVFTALLRLLAIGWLFWFLHGISHEVPILPPVD
jgi:hypothetical protein